ncbi:fumarylacetoacetate hydrolase family protein [Thalassotalea sp. PLHSN55]|uniref:fumarylacetoacetate hydrolase family protein n=1 Tax=Thalassotalea sp. PLHSN55 TaxID=3435888 RepID=UPI003F82C1B0
MNTISVDNQPITPSKVVCIGRNYVDHITELGNEVPDEMVVFLKPNSAISAELNAFHQEALHYEGELSFVYQQGKFTAVGFGLDLTKRGLQSQLKSKGLPWERAKAFNGAAVFSPFVSLDVINDDLSLALAINNKPTQAGGVALMMVKPQDILAELATFIDLTDGDIVMTGTPKGVGQINVGDNFHGQVLQGDKVLVEASWQAK